MADEHMFPVGDFPFGLGAAPFFGSNNLGGVLPWACSAELQIPTSDSAVTTAQQHLDSALSSLVSSPAHAGCGVVGDDDVSIGDLIVRLGSICNASANNSCHSTPLSSPPRGAFRQGGGGRLSRVASSKSLGAAVPEAETSPAAACKTTDARKRKSTAANGSPKRSKVAGDGDEDVAISAAAPDAAEEKKPEPVKDYIQVRARRGQATDSHSLAERVRREKISERMKLLQSLVPGCDKITGKAPMLDEIINYVQSLQRQVEFLSMKLWTMNPQLHVDAQYLPKDVVVSPPLPQNQTAFSLAGAAAVATMESFSGSSIFHPAGSGGFGGWDDLQSIVQPAPTGEVCSCCRSSRRRREAASDGGGDNSEPAHEGGGGAVIL